MADEHKAAPAVDPGKGKGKDKPKADGKQNGNKPAAPVAPLIHQGNADSPQGVAYAPQAGEHEADKTAETPVNHEAKAGEHPNVGTVGHPDHGAAPAPVTLTSTAATAAVTEGAEKHTHTAKQPEGDKPAAAAATPKAEDPAKEPTPPAADAEKSSGQSTLAVAAEVAGALAVIAIALKAAEAKGDHTQASKLSALETRLSELRAHLTHLGDDLAQEIGDIVTKLKVLL